jgi:hypothetical protein
MKAPFDIEILEHTERNGRFVTNEQRVIDLAATGILDDCGPQAIAGGAHCLLLNRKGRQRLAEWRASLPKPKPRTGTGHRF